LPEQLHRVRVIVTCRSSEWHQTTEQEPLESLAADIGAARQRHGIEPSDVSVLAITFAPLTEDAIDTLGRAHGTDDAFIDAMHASAWRPPAW
jgi:hypothetical protein